MVSQNANAPVRCEQLPTSTCKTEGWYELEISDFQEDQRAMKSKNRTGWIQKSNQKVVAEGERKR